MGTDSIREKLADALLNGSNLSILMHSGIQIEIAKVITLNGPDEGDIARIQTYKRGPGLGNFVRYGDVMPLDINDIEYVMTFTNE